MCKILKWFKHEEILNTETEGDRRAREAFRNQKHVVKNVSREYTINPLNVQDYIQLSFRHHVQTRVSNGTI